MNAPEPYRQTFLDGRVSMLVGDVRAMLKTLPDAHFDCVVTSPPYWGLRDYDTPGQIGLEPTLAEHIEILVDVFREVRRVLKLHGTLWLNYGDCYAAAPNGKSAAEYKADGSDDRTFRDKPFSTVGPINRGKRLPPGEGNRWGGGNAPAQGTLKPKDLCMIPNRLAIALQDDGWYVRSEIIWHKPNPMPESVYDRPTSAHEKVWLLAKGEEYFYNHAAIRESVTGGSHARAPGPNSRESVDPVPRSRKIKVPDGWDIEKGSHGTINRSGRTSATYRDLPGVTPKSAPEESNIRAKGSFHASTTQLVESRNARNVWTIAARAYREAHFATFPPALAERCIKAGVPATVCGCCGAVSGCGLICEAFPRVPGRVLDCFGGAGTVGLVAKQLGIDAILIELNPEYAEMARRRIEAAQDNSLSDGESLGSLPSGESEPSVTLACAPSDNPGPEAVPFGLDAGAAIPDRDQPITDLPNPFSTMSRSASNIVVGKHGETSTVEHDDARPIIAAGRASIPFEYPELPEALRRTV